MRASVTHAAFAAARPRGVNRRRGPAMILRIVLPLALLAAFSLHAGAAHASGDFACDADLEARQERLQRLRRRPVPQPRQRQPGEPAAAAARRRPRARSGRRPRPTPPTPPIAGSAAPFTLAGLLGAAGRQGRRPTTARTTRAARAAAAAATPAARRRSRPRWQASAVPAAERASLTAARNAHVAELRRRRTPSPPTRPPADVRSPHGRQFASYLAGVAEFYGGDWDDARKDFARRGRQPAAVAEGDRALHAGPRRAQPGARPAPSTSTACSATAKVDAAALTTRTRLSRPTSSPTRRAPTQPPPAGCCAGSPGSAASRSSWPATMRRRFAPPIRPSATSRSSDLVVEADTKLLHPGGADRHQATRRCWRRAT